MTHFLAIMCAGVTTYKALKELKCVVGSYVAIVGAGGGLGHLAIQYANVMGFRALAVEIPKKLEYCSSLGAEFVLDATSPNTIDTVKELSEGGCQGVICIAPYSDAFTTSIHMARKGGTIVCCGLGNGDFSVTIKGTVDSSRI